MTIWLVLFYIFAALCVMFVLFMLNLGHQRFRGDDSDITNQVGYEENPAGDRIGHTVDGDQSAVVDETEPHTLNAPTSHNGST